MTADRLPLLPLVRTLRDLSCDLKADKSCFESRTAETTVDIEHQANDSCFEARTVD